MSTARVITPSQSPVQRRSPTRRFAVGLARALAGAIIFALPLLMTVEMWWLGFSMPPVRIALLVGVLLPLLVGMSAISGFEPTHDVWEDVRDACVAFAVGVVSSAGILLLLAVFTQGMSGRELVGKATLQAVPASIGALLARSQLGGGEEARRERAERAPSYWAELLLMTVGALFLAFNVAPTEEIVLIAYRLPLWSAVGVVVVSVIAMHAFVYAVEFHGQEAVPEGMPAWLAFLRLTVVGYAIALLVSAYVLWTFGRFTGNAPLMIVIATVVLAFPAAIGAAAARLLL